jgi:hypothetical protein
MTSVPHATNKAAATPMIVRQNMTWLQSQENDTRGSD